MIAGATHEATNLADAITGYLEQVFGSFDQILVAARFTALTPASRLVLKHMAEVSHLGGSILSLSLYDTTGTLVASTAPETPSVNIADRIWFKDFRDRTDDRLFIGPPITSRTVNRLSVILARGIRDNHGRFQGMVGMSISPEFFAAFFRHMPLGNHGVIKLIGRDSTIYVRVSSKSVTYGQPVTTSGLSTMIKQAEVTPIGTSFVSSEGVIDHVATYFSFHALPSYYPLIVTVGISEDDILEVYRSETQQIIAVALLFSCALIVGTVIAQRRMNITCLSG